MRKLALPLAALTMLASAVYAQEPARTNVYLVPGSHLDLGFMDSLSAVREKRIRLLDEAMDAAERDPDFVWFEEAGWTAETWLDRYQLQPERIQQLRRLVLKGQIGFGASMLSAYSSAFPEGLPLLTMHLDRVEKTLGVRPDVAVVNDVPTVDAAFRDAMLRAGVHRLLMGPNLVFSAPMPDMLTRRPFRWRGMGGDALIVFIDPDHYTTGFARWGLPPRCAREFEPLRFGRSTSDAEVIRRGVAYGMQRVHQASGPLLLQHAFDNWDTTCARMLPSSLAAWNTHASGAAIRLAQPSAFFDALAELPTRHGDWGGDWDVIRAAEPVWTWRLRQAMRAVDERTPHEARLALVSAMEHNVGLGARWQPGLSMAVARTHIKDVHDLYLSATRATLGPQGSRLRPEPFALPSSATWPATWKAVAGERSTAVRLRAQGHALDAIVGPDATPWQAPLRVAANDQSLVARATIDRRVAASTLGPQYRIAMEFAIRRPRESLTLSKAGANRGNDGWLTSLPPYLVSPGGVELASRDGLGIHVEGPLVVAWGLVPDAVKPDLSWLQALTVIGGTRGEIGNQAVLLPFNELFPGEPERLDVDVRLQLVSPPQPTHQPQTTEEGAPPPATRLGSDRGTIAPLP